MHAIIIVLCSCIDCVCIYNHLHICTKCSGDTDGRVPVTSTKYSINAMKLKVKTQWHPWLLKGQVITNFSSYINTLNKLFMFC